MYDIDGSVQHVLAEAERVATRLKLHAEAIRRAGSRPVEDEFRGLCISEEEVDELIAAGGPETGSGDGIGGLVSPLAARLQQAERDAEAIRVDVEQEGGTLRLSQLKREYGLNDFEVETLLVCLLPEIDSRYERLLAYLNDDVTRKRPTIGMALECLAGGSRRLAARWSFLPSAPLAAYHLLRIGDDRDSGSMSFLSRTLRIDDRIANYLLGSNEIDSRIRGCVRLVSPGTRLGDMAQDEALGGQLRRLAGELGGYGDGVCYIWGPPETGRKTVAEALCESTGRPMLIADTPGLRNCEVPFEMATSLVAREAQLQSACVCWADIDPLMAQEENAAKHLRSVIEGTSRLRSPAYLTGQVDWHPGEAFNGRAFVTVALPLPSGAQRRVLWNSCLDVQQTDITDAELNDVADRFKLNAGQIKNAAAAAKGIARSDGRTSVSTSDVYAACRAASNQKLSTLARKVQPRFGWDDIVLPRDQMLQLREIAAWVKHGSRVYEDWNFNSKLALGRGLNVLFAGPSGTGKTMAADILANELGIDLYKIDLATVVSKYIGETEKNLDRIFGEAQSSNAVLFFDEADAIFGKRSEVRDSHDRYANIEIAYLLQKMEEYEGIAILATNLRKNLDEAFARRMHFCIEFPLPEEPERHRIWQRIFPGEAPLSGDVDLGFLARQFKITGGNIKNIALGAAFLAATDGGTVCMEHLMRATKREYQKVGRLCTEADFGPYFNVVKG